MTENGERGDISLMDVSDNQGDQTVLCKNSSFNQPTPLMATPSRRSPTSISSLEDDLADAESFHSDRESVPASRLMSGITSPMPESPGQITPNRKFSNNINYPMNREPSENSQPNFMMSLQNSDNQRSYEYTNTPTIPTTTDEMKSFGDEGSCASPMTGLSELTMDHTAATTPHSIATPPSQRGGLYGFSFAKVNQEAALEDTPKRQVYIPKQDSQVVQNFAAEETASEDESCSSSLSDDGAGEELLENCINSAQPKSNEKLEKQREKFGDGCIPIMQIPTDDVDPNKITRLCNYMDNVMHNGSQGTFHSSSKTEDANLDETPNEEKYDQFDDRGQMPSFMIFF